MMPSLGESSYCDVCMAVYRTADGHNCPGPRRSSLSPGREPFMAGRTYTKTFGKFTQGVTVEAHPGVVIEHPFDSSSGAGFGRKHRTPDPERLAREIGEDLEADGWTRARG